MAPFSLSKQPRRSLPEGYQFGDAAHAAQEHVVYVDSDGNRYVAGRLYAGRGPDINTLSRMTPPLSGPGADYSTNRDLGDEA